MKVEFCLVPLFESSVNSEGIETTKDSVITPFLFESSVNSEGIETFRHLLRLDLCLRAV